MEIATTKRVIDVLVLIFVVVAAFGAGFFIYPMIADHDLNIALLSKQINDTNQSCNTGKLVEDSYCLRDVLRPNFKYNITQINKQLTEEQLYVQGGVCSQYTEWYKTRLLERGYYVATPTIKIDSHYNHVFAIASNNESYCILDQMSVTCLVFEN